MGRNSIRLITLLSLSLLFSGCLSIVRPWMPHGPSGVSRQVGDDPHNYVTTTNTWWCYPTFWMRCSVTVEPFKYDNPKMGNAKYAVLIPVTLLWITSPIDFTFDTLLAPWDIYYHYYERKKDECDCKTDDSGRVYKPCGLHAADVQDTR